MKKTQSFELGMRRKKQEIHFYWPPPWHPVHTKGKHKEVAMNTRKHSGSAWTFGEIWTDGLWFNWGGRWTGGEDECISSRPRPQLTRTRILRVSLHYLTLKKFHGFLLCPKWHRCGSAKFSFCKKTKRKTLGTGWFWKIKESVTYKNRGYHPYTLRIRAIIHGFSVHVHEQKTPVLIPALYFADTCWSWKMRIGLKNQVIRGHLGGGPDAKGARSPQCLRHRDPGQSLSLRHRTSGQTKSPPKFHISKKQVLSACLSENFSFCCAKPQNLSS